MTRRAFERAVEAARPALVKAAWKSVSRDDAEDIAQDAIVVALSSSDWAGVKDVENWLYKIVFNLRQSAAQTAARRAKIAPAAHDDEVESELDIVDALAEIDENDEAAQQLASIMDAAERAGLTRREDYIFLARLRDKSYQEIAEALGADADSVRASYSWALKKIRTVIAAEAGAIK